MSRKPGNGPSAFWQRLPANLPIAYLLWLISLGLFVVDFFFGRIFFVAVAELAGLGYWQVSFFDRLGVFVMGVAAASSVILIEYYYRKGVEKGALWPRFVKVTGWQVGLVLAGMLAASLAGK